MTYRFADCVLDPSRRRLMRAGAPRDVEPQVFDLLVLFADNAGRALGKQEIVDAIWHGRAISDAALTSRIKAARSAIGDSGREQRLIRTLHRVGYLFDTEVEIEGETTPPAPPVNPSEPRTEVRFFRDRAGRSIAYGVRGEGPLVILPAWWISNVAKDEEDPDFASFIAALGEGMTLVRYDRPGAGMSDPDDAERSLADEADLLDDLVAELGAEQYDMFAMSAAGPVAVVHAAAHPDRVRRICFYGTFLNGAELGPDEVLRALVSTVRAHWGMGSRVLADVFLPHEDGASIDNFARMMRTAASAETAARLLALTYRMDASAHVGGVRAPSLVIHRKKDRGVPAQSARDFAAGLKDARLVMLDGAAHPPWIGGTQVANLANRFLRGLD